MEQNGHLPDTRHVGPNCAEDVDFNETGGTYPPPLPGALAQAMLGPAGQG